jgi:hypothetical protein
LSSRWLSLQLELVPPRWSWRRLPIRDGELNSLGYSLTLLVQPALPMPNHRCDRLEEGGWPRYRSR